MSINYLIGMFRLGLGINLGIYLLAMASTHSRTCWDSRCCWEMIVYTIGTAPERDGD